MDNSSSNRKRKGFIKAKLVMPIYRSTPKSPPSSSNSYSAGPTGGGLGTFVINREITTAPPPKQKVAFAAGNGIDASLQYRRKFDSIYGVPGDEKVDLKAATYINSVQERFRRDSNVECHDTKHLVHAT